MTVATTVARTVVTGNGSATTFAYTFKINSNSELVVTKTDADGADTALAEGTHYSVAGAGGASGGTVTYPLAGPALASGERLTLRRVVPLTQETDLTNQGAFYAEVHESQFDASCMADQQLQEQLGRTLTFAVSDQCSGQLPNAAARANRVLMFDADGAPAVGDYVGGAGGLFTASGTGAVERTYLAKGREVVSVKDFGAAGNGTTDDYAAFQAALDAAGSGSLHVPSGTYRIGTALQVTATNGLRVCGDGAYCTTLQADFDGNALTFQGCSFCSVQELCVQHANAHTGAGLAFQGEGGSNLVDRCFFANNTTNGLAFVGTALVYQSSNRVNRCLFLQNGTHQLLFQYSNDGEVTDCAFGNATAPYSTSGCYLQHASAGSYTGCEHWGNVNALVLEDCHYVRIADNRFEESRQAAVAVDGSTHCNFGGNLLHTNSQASTGTYSALQLDDVQWWNINGNHFLSWNSGTYQHAHSVTASASCDRLLVTGNMSRHNTGADFDTAAATNVTLADNMP